jgi:hypothetical protein
MPAPHPGQRRRTSPRLPQGFNVPEHRPRPADRGCGHRFLGHRRNRSRLDLGSPPTSRIARLARRARPAQSAELGLSGRLMRPSQPQRAA